MARKLLNAYILLFSDRSPEGPGRTAQEISHLLPVCARSVGRLRKHFVLEGLGAALNRKLPDHAYVRVLWAATPKPS